MTGPALAAAVLAAVVVGVLWAAPGLGHAARGPKLVSLLLGVDTGAILVGGIALAAAAARSWMLIGEPTDPARTADAVLDVSRLDGDSDLFALLIVVIGLLTLLTVAVIGTATRSASGASVGDRAVVGTVLSVQVILGLFALGWLLFAGGGPTVVVCAAHLPLSIGALLIQHRHRPRRQLAYPR